MGALLLPPAHSFSTALPPFSVQLHLKVLANDIKDRKVKSDFDDGGIASHSLVAF